MNQDLIVARDIVEQHIREVFERAWREVVGSSESLKYEILIWGSTVEDNREATDLDLIFRYERSKISSSKEDSISGYIQSQTHTEYFTKVDPLVAQYDTVPSIINRSRISNVYRVDDESWINMSSGIENK